MAVLDDVKILLDIPEEETGLNNKLNLIIENAEKQVLSYLPSGTESVPTVLEYIVCEMAVSRFNRIGNEGMSSYSQEGESITYGDDISPYLPAIKAWNDMQKDNTKGRMRFL
ncbi:phage head-tail connector protein [Faecalicatena contorta]|jgi:phage gp36-like protein|uniref:phage head-tail connector protein n=1 Tax=Faecalicatena contorta TaxID=39482 RepID=UPI0031DB1D41